MKNEREVKNLAALLNTVMADDDWLALNASLKREAMATMDAARRRRRVQHSLCRFACVAALLTAVAWWFRPSVPGNAPVTQAAAQPVPAIDQQYIGEEEMLAAFPPGSCVLAEIDGQKRLIFFDAKSADKGFAWNGR
jgi:hypothetical protein